MSADSLRVTLDRHATYRRGGTVADFGLGLLDARGERHELRAWAFNNQHYLLTLFVEEGRIIETRIVMPADMTSTGAIDVR